MLSKIRNIANSTLSRIFIGLVALAFISWGAIDNNSDGSKPIVTFNKAQSINQKAFMLAKFNELNAIEQGQGARLSEEQIKEYQIDKLILNKLINNSILMHIAETYNFRASDTKAIDVVKQLPLFKNEQGSFDADLFKLAFKNSPNKEAEYILSIKDDIVKNNIISILTDRAIIPDKWLNLIAQDLSNKYNVNIIKINLDDILNKIENTRDEELKTFYDQNHVLFTTPERRNISYIKFLKSDIYPQIGVSQNDIDNYLKEANESEDSNKLANLETVDIIKQQKYGQELSNLNKKLEIDIAAGATLAEIAKDNNMTITNIDEITFDNTKDINLEPIKSNLFELNKDELSYPLELNDNLGLIIAQINDIIPAYLSEFSTITEVVKSQYSKVKNRQSNIEYLKNIAKNYSPNSKIPKGLSVTKFTFNKLDKTKLNNDLPKELINLIFASKTNSTTNIITKDKAAYFAYISSISTNKTSNEEVIKLQKDDLNENLQNIILQEVISYYLEQNEVKFNSENMSFDDSGI